MDDAEAIKTVWQTAQVNLLPFDGQHERLGKSHPRHFTERGLNYRHQPRLWTRPVRCRAVLSPANWSGHICSGGKFLKPAHYSVRSRSAQRGDWSADILSAV